MYDNLKHDFERTQKMAFDGSAVYAVAAELNSKLSGGRIMKIAQTERDELILTVKNAASQYRLLISANPSLPICYLTDQSKNSLPQAPAFCMLLRKHMLNGRIISVSPPSMERIIDIETEHYDEMGDLCRIILTVELMGKYSNIILRSGSTVTDSIRHVSALMSSVREVIPGREYFIPFSDKLNPFETDPETFSSVVFSEGSLSAAKSLYSHITGFSPMLSEEILYRAGIDSDRPASSIREEEKDQIYAAFADIMNIIRNNPAPNIVFRNSEPVAFGTFRYRIYESPEYSIREYDSMSELLYEFYSQKQSFTSLRQKTADLRQIVHTLLNKDYKKYDLQMRQLKDTEKKDKFRLYGELLTAYGYNIPSGSKVFETTDFYTGNPVSVPLDPSISAIENGKNYFNKYSKMKRTADALGQIIIQTRQEIDHLESIMLSLDIVNDPVDIAELRRELSESGYIKKQSSDAGSRKKAKAAGRSVSYPLHYISSDGFHIYVGKNNTQNDYLSFSFAAPNDWWFHAKDRPGSHVILKTEGKELTDISCEEAASLAAHYSKSSGEGKVEVQYTLRKNLKKPPGSKPGFVVFNTYYSLSAGTDISGIVLNS